MGEQEEIIFKRYINDRSVLKIVFYLFLLVWGITGLFLTGEVLSYLLIDYPFNYYEPEIIMEAWRLSEGAPIYLNPEQGPHAGIYAPLTQIVVAGLFQILSPSLLIARFLSFFSLILIGFITARWARAKSIAHLLFIFTVIFIWHENLLHFELHGKPDSFAVLLIVTATYFIYKYWNNKSLPYLVISALAMALSIAAKQNMLFALPAILIALFLYRTYRDGVLYLSFFVLFSVILWYVLYLGTGSYIFYYTFELPGEFPFRWAMLFSGTYRLLGSVWMSIGVGVFIYRWYKQQLNFSDTLLILLLLFAWPACLMTFAKGGGLSNAFLPFYVILSIYISINLPLGYFWGKTKQQLNAPSTESKYYTCALIIFMLAIATTANINLPGLITTYKFRLQANENYQNLVEDLKMTESDVYAPFDNYLTLKTGRPIWYSKKNQRDLSITGTTPDAGYRDIALNYINVVTTHIENSDNTIEQLLWNNNYHIVNKYPTQQSFTYYWWKKIDTGPHGY